MRYFFDTEFIERFHKPLFGKSRHVIDLISIGIVAEDGREYSAISNEYRYKDASPWVQKNVIDQLYSTTIRWDGDPKSFLSVENFHKVYGKSNKQIAEEIVKFVNPGVGPDYDPLPVDYEYVRQHNCKEVDTNGIVTGVRAQPDFFGYFSDYDWVLLCSLFGTMMDLPNGFPMYCIDLKQMLDGKVKARYKTGDSKDNFDKALVHIKSHPEYPVTSAYAHNALCDARWNRDLYNFLMNS